MLDTYSVHCYCDQVSLRSKSRQSIEPTLSPSLRSESLNCAAANGRRGRGTYRRGPQNAKFRADSGHRLWSSFGGGDEDEVCKDRDDKGAHIALKCFAIRFLAFFARLLSTENGFQHEPCTIFVSIPCPQTCRDLNRILAIRPLTTSSVTQMAAITAV